MKQEYILVWFGKVLFRFDALLVVLLDLAEQSLFVVAQRIKLIDFGNAVRKEFLRKIEGYESTAASNTFSPILFLLTSPFTCGIGIWPAIPRGAREFDQLTGHTTKNCSPKKPLFLLLAFCFHFNLHGRYYKRISLR